ncbi:MAG TPA: hypothetical protein VFV64_01290 [Permianibacter sp.]|nr:hypothetical protein [Permianibacter sp.]
MRAGMNDSVGVMAPDKPESQRRERRNNSVLLPSHDDGSCTVPNRSTSASTTVIVD